MASGRAHSECTRPTLQRSRVGQRPQEIKLKRAKGRWWGIRPGSCYRSPSTARAWDTQQDAGNSLHLPCGAAAGVQGRDPPSTPAGRFQMSGITARGVPGSWASGCRAARGRGTGRAGRYARATPGSAPLPSPRASGRAGRRAGEELASAVVTAAGQAAPWAASGCTVPAQGFRQGREHPPARLAGASRWGQGPEVP